MSLRHGVGERMERAPDVRGAEARSTARLDEEARAAVGVSSARVLKRQPRRRAVARGREAGNRMPCVTEARRGERPERAGNAISRLCGAFVFG